VKELFEVIYEDTELLVVNKPADLVCHPTKGDEYSSLVGRLRLYLGEGSQPQLVNRLDRETSGLTVVGKTAVAARRLRHLWENRLVQKEYLALVHGHPVPDREVIDAPLGPDITSRVAIKDCVRPDGKPAQTEFQVVRRFTRRVGLEAGSEKLFALLNVRPRTGRKHQIRIHLASIGHPVVGDKLYGGNEGLYLALVEGRLTPDERAMLLLPNHALHAHRLEFEWRGKNCVFKADGGDWSRWGQGAAARANTLQ
jgi:23S rRNA pseudouridine1911/1915/1917 synthase